MEKSKEEIRKEIQEFKEQSEQNKEFVEMVESADETQRKQIASLLLCTYVFGDEFCSDMKPYLEVNDIKGMINNLSKWQKRLDYLIAREKARSVNK